MIIPYQEHEIEVEITNIKSSKDRYGSYDVIDLEYTFDYDLPSQLNHDDFEQHLFDNHLEQLENEYE